MIKNLKDQKGVRILSENYVGHLAFIEGETPYILPITYYYDKENHRILSYSSQGHKIQAMRKHNLVALCVDEIDSVNQWRSVLIHGEFEEIKGSDAKFLLHRFAEGVKEVIARKEKKHLDFISEFSSKLQSQGIPIIYQIKITDTTGKYRE